VVVDPGGSAFGDCGTTLNFGGTVANYGNMAASMAR